MPGVRESNHCAAGAARTAKPARRAEGRMPGVKRRAPCVFPCEPCRGAPLDCGRHKSFRRPADAESLSLACPRESNQREGHPASIVPPRLRRCGHAGRAGLFDRTSCPDEKERASCPFPCGPCRPAPLDSRRDLGDGSLRIALWSRCVLRRLALCAATELPYRFPSVGWDPASCPCLRGFRRPADAESLSLACPRPRLERGRTAQLARRAEGTMPGVRESNHCAAGAARTAKPARRAEGRMPGVKRRAPCVFPCEPCRGAPLDCGRHKSFRRPADAESLSLACPRESNQREGHPASIVPPRLRRCGHAGRAGLFDRTSCPDEKERASCPFPCGPCRPAPLDSRRDLGDGSLRIALWSRCVLRRLALCAATELPYRFPSVGWDPASCPCLRGFRRPADAESLSLACPRPRLERGRTAQLARRAEGRMPGVRESNHCAAGAARTAKPARRAEGRMPGVKRRAPCVHRPSAPAALRARGSGRAFRQDLRQLLLRCSTSDIHVLACPGEKERASCPFPCGPCRPAPLDSRRDSVTARCASPCAATACSRACALRGDRAPLPSSQRRLGYGES